MLIDCFEIAGHRRHDLVGGMRRLGATYGTPTHKPIKISNWHLWLWHPNTPNLCTLRSMVKDGTLVVDQTTTRIGIRGVV